MLRQYPSVGLVPRVLNIKNLPGFKHEKPVLPRDGVYIGRRMSRYGLEESVWANPFKEGRDGTLSEVIAKYHERLLQQPELLARLHELRGRALCCWCWPKPCHGDVLLRLANAIS
jgi:hypothetical protein